MKTNKKEAMIGFWSERARQFQADPRANTNDIWLREVEINYTQQVFQTHKFSRALDFGCANGYTTTRLAKMNSAVTFMGVDINPDMIRVASSFPESEGLPKLSFRQVDVLTEKFDQQFDFIYAIRVFQNIETEEKQKQVFDKLFDRLSSGGRFLYVESYADGYGRLNEDRVTMGLTPLPIHPHLTLLTDSFDAHVEKHLTLVKRDYLSSSYYLITRLLYSYIAKMNGEEIDYNHPIHQVAAIVPQVGDYGPQIASLFRKE
jgi:SAM-dependent methyltransferase